MADGQIKYTDLFDEKLINDVGSLKKSLEEVRATLQGMVADVKNNAEDLKNALTPKGAGQNKATIDAVKEAYEKMGIVVDGVTDKLEKLAVTEKDAKNTADGVIITQKEMNKVVKLASDYNPYATKTYAQLTKQYSAMKIIINQLSKAEGENSDVVKKMVADAKAIYEQMNMLQQSTGKYQLQVGNYSKALGGLNLATNQVIRELPVLANGMSMFVMAISNNIPILIDNIKLFKQEQAALKAKKDALLATGDAAKIAAAEEIKLTSVTKAMLALLGSWETWIVIILSVLPGFIRKLKEKKEAQEELNKELREGIDLETAYNDALVTMRKSYVEEVSKLKTLYHATQDQNRSEEERLRIAKVLLNNFKEEFRGYDALAIVQGKARKKYDETTDAMLRQARVQAYLDKITELEKKRIDILFERQKTAKENAELTEKLHKAQAKKNSDFDQFEINSLVRKLHKKQEKFKEYKDSIAEIEESVRTLERGIKAGEFETLIEEEKPTGSSRIATKKSILNKDLEIERGARKLLIDAMEEGYRKEIELSDEHYNNLIEDKQIYLAEQEALDEKDREITLKGISELQDQIFSLIQAKEEAHNTIRAKSLEKAEKEWERKVKEHQKRWKEDFGLEALPGIAPSKEQEETLKEALQRIKIELDTADNEDLVRYDNKHRREQAFLQNEVEYWKKYKDILEKFGVLTETELNNINANIERAESEMAKATPKSLLGWIAYGADEDWDNKGFERQLESMFSTAFGYMNEFMDKRMEMARVNIEAAEKESNEAKKYLDAELEARKNGYAHNLGYARAQYEQQMALKRKALEEEQRIAKVQQAIDDAQQISSLLVATANIWASYTKENVFGAVLAGIATASMWSSFAAAKIQASQMVKTKEYGEGMSEYLDYGGSHASGNDIDFGTMKDGTRRRVERGEMVAVINKKNVSKYGAGEVSDIIKSLNTGTFEDRYGLAFAGMGLASPGADLSELEKGMKTLVSQGEKKVVRSGDVTIEYYKNRKRIIRN